MMKNILMQKNYHKIVFHFSFHHQIDKSIIVGQPWQWWYIFYQVIISNCHLSLDYTWCTRYLIEASSGLFTGSVYRDKSILRWVSQWQCIVMLSVKVLTVILERVTWVRQEVRRMAALLSRKLITQLFMLTNIRLIKSTVNPEHVADLFFAGLWHFLAQTSRESFQWQGCARD